MKSKIEPHEAPRIRYVKLGQNHRWWRQCLDQSILRLGFESGNAEIAAAAARADWGAVREFWAKRGVGTPAQFANQMREFFEDDGSTLWITFEDGCLYYGFTNGAEVTPIEEDGEKEASSFRRMNAEGWRNTDAKHQVLRIDQLSGALTKTAAYRQTVCKLAPEVEDYLRLRLQAKVSQSIEATEEAKRQLVHQVAGLIRTFTWADFETLTELIFAQSGWRRISRTGGNQRTTDLDLENPVTGDRAFVQVKSATEQTQLEDYIQKKAFEKSDYNRMFYVYHTGDVSTESDDVTLWDVDKVALQVVQNGLIDWVISKAK